MPAAAMLMTARSQQPVAPSNLQLTVVGGARIDLAWTDNSGNESGFRIERCSGSGCSGFAEVQVVGAGVTTWSNTGLSNDTTYRYRVRAYRLGAGVSAYSNQPEATTLGVPDLVSVGVSDAGGDACTGGGSNWVLTPSWTTTGPNDADYKIVVLYSDEASPSTWNPLADNQTTASSSVQQDTGIQGNVGGSSDPVTYYRTYRIQLVRKSDSQVIEQMDTATESLTVYSEPCA